MRTKSMNTHFLLLILIGLFLHSCGSSGGKKRNKPEPTAVTEEPEEEPDPVIPPKTNEDDVGIEVGTVDEDTGVSFESENGEKLVHLVVKSTTDLADYKHTSEFLMIVRANEKTCINVKIRPGTAISGDLDQEQFKDSVEQIAEPCSETALNLNSHSESSSTNSTKKLEDAFLLTPPSPDLLLAAGNQENNNLCSQRNFRMEALPEGTDENTIDLGANDVPREVLTTYGTLAAKSSGGKIKIWVDSNYAEATQICSGGSVNAFTPNPVTQYRSAQDKAEYNGFGDSLLQTQLQTLADVSEKILGSMETNFGATGDLDGNGAVNIFISPFVNRLQFRKTYSTIVDTFQALPLYRPGDLAPLNNSINPSSNEGEVVYLWSPSPGGTVDYQIYPSSNSLNTNYAYGNVAYQLMGLILSKAKLVDQKIIEERFLREALSYLASIYYGGGAYSFREISHFLNSYTPLLSLTDKIDFKNFQGAAKSEAVSGQLGMRALFGWYLHTKICGTNEKVPCAGIKTLLTSSKTGTALLEDQFSLKWPEILDHFSSSVGIGLIDDPATAFPIANAALDNLPDLIEFKHVQEFNVTGTVNVVNEHNSSLSALTGTTMNEPAYFSPYPTLEHHPFRVMSPNSDIELNLEKDAVAYVLLTGIVSEYTDITTYLGKGLKVTALPIGERDLSRRSVYVESVSKDISLDTRPVKLFQDPSAVVPAKQSQFIWETVSSVVEDDDFVVTMNKEAWISGEINNTKINVEGASAVVGDSDQYLIKVDPCATGDDDGGGTSTIAGCADTDEFSVLVQVYVNPGPDKLTPVAAVTPQDRRAYHGAMVWPSIKTVDSQFEPIKDSLFTQANYMCEAALDSDDGIYDSTAGCQMSGLALADSTCNGTSTSDSSPRKECLTAESTGFSFVTDSVHEIADTTVDGFADYGHDFIFDNFLYMGGGFPLDTTDTIEKFQSPIPNVGVRMFTKEEKNRMFYNFTFDTKLLPDQLTFHPVRHGFLDRTVVTGTQDGIKLDPEWIEIDEDSVQDLVIVRNRIFSTADAAADLADDDPFVGICSSFNVDPEACKQPCSSVSAVLSGIQRYLTEGDYMYICREDDTDNCPGKSLFLDHGSAAGDAAATCTIATASNGNFFESAFLTTELAQDRFIWTATSVAGGFSYYRPTMPESADGSRCAGAPASSNLFGICSQLVHPDMDSKDLRNQFWLDSSRVRVKSSCSGLVYPDEFGFCSDRFSFDKVSPDASLIEAPAFRCYDDQGGFTDPSRVLKGAVNYRSGELIGLAERIYPISFKVKGDRATVLPILIGGLNNSQGKYLIRVRTFDSAPCYELP